MKTFNIAVIPGDGVGQETVPAAWRVLELAGQLSNAFAVRSHVFDWSCAYYQRHGHMMPDNGLDLLKPFDAIFLGAVGFPPVPDHVSLWGLLLPIRRGFDQYINLRPIKLLRGITSPLCGYHPGDIDFVVIRENTEGEYSNSGGRLRVGTPQEVVVQNSVFTRFGTERVIRYAFNLARASRQSLTSATKSNGINFSMPFWDEVFQEVGEEYPDVKQVLYHIDALAAYFVTRPQTFDVVVGSNLFGDILTDLGAAIQGSIGIAASANINPEGQYPSMFEPVHGSAPDIAGKGLANPIGQIWTAKLMVDHLGFPDVGATILEAIERALEKGHKTPDLGGTDSTQSVTEAVMTELRHLYPPL
ncbi:tartrate dehydrogenase [Sulfobacillus sp. hq2]|uniref:tartrate dehydrogenase n=1 Tax=Sulfobacillus sp. hq2 TaxID=2039167 RepID=UPI000CD28A43|nr:tartrate dehydrogenase [Sulfobacillus sp. hq2]POB11316.1 tartrate dehydrogenase [Sulfobacillus sp. hq2]